MSDGTYSKQNYRLNIIILIVSLIIMVGNLINAAHILGFIGN